MTLNEKVIAAAEQEAIRLHHLQRRYEQALYNLLAQAIADNIILQVDIVSDQPPAMGNYHQVISSRLVR